MRLLEWLLIALAVLGPAFMVIAQADQGQKTEAVNRERAMGVCFSLTYNPTGQEHSAFLSPEYAAAGYFALYENRETNEPPSSNVELVEPPKHGKVTYSKYEDGLFHHKYIPNPGYVGDDKLVFKVHVDGQIVRLVYLLKISRTVVSNQSDDVFCKKTGTQWKISLGEPHAVPSGGAQHGTQPDAQKQRAG